MNPLPRRCRKPATATNIQDETGIVMHARNFGERRRISLKTPRFVVCFQGFGGMAEWLKAAVLKTVKPQGFVGSNPTASARETKARLVRAFFKCRPLSVTKKGLPMHVSELI